MGETRVMSRRKKLIKEEAREKSIRHGNPKTLDLVQYYPTSCHSHGRMILPLQIPLHGVPRHLTQGVCVLLWHIRFVLHIRLVRLHFAVG